MLYSYQARQNQEGSLDVVTGMLQVFDLDVYAFLESVTTLSFLAPYIAVQFSVSPETSQNLFQSLLQLVT